MKKDVLPGGTKAKRGEMKRKRMRYAEKRRRK
jgi:hypothetical protein